MRCADILNRMPDAMLREMEASGFFAEKLKQGHRLQDILTSPSMLRFTFESLHRMEKEALGIIVRHIGYEPFDDARLEKCGEGAVSGAELRFGLIRLRQRGIVFALRKTWGEHVYIIPSDTYPVWQSLVLPGPFTEDDSVPDERVRAWHGNGLGLAGDLFALLTYIARNELPLTQKGTLHKRHVQKITEQLQLQRCDLSGLQLKYAHQDAYPPAFAVVLDIALRLGLIRQDIEKIRLNTGPLGAWLRMPRETMDLALYKLWTQIYVPSPLWIGQAAAALRFVPPGKWFPLGRIAEWLNEHELRDGGASGEDAIKEFVERWLGPLAGFGWVELGQTEEDGTPVFRWTIRPDPTETMEAGLDELGKHDADDRFFVQPDFEIVVPWTVPFDVRWELECMADAQQIDRVSTYRLSRESLARAMENGRTMEEVLRFLQMRAKYGIPEHVEQTLAEWGMRYGQMRFAEVTLLRVDDAGTAAEIAGHPECAAYLFAAVGDRDFIVLPEHIRHLMQALEKHGYHPRKTVEKAGESPSYTFPRLETGCAGESAGDLEPASEANHSRGLIYSRFAVQYYEIEDKWPKPEDIYPRLQEVPSMWLKDLRSYHASTRKELMQKAIEWRALVLLRRNGGETLFAPRTVRESGGSWSVSGWDRIREISLSPEQWEEMQLILPGINDK